MSTRFVESADGTRIAFERTGSGPAVILVGGAMNYRGMGPNDGLAEQLAGAFTVYNYDRRGRGESGDTAPYAVEREIDDLRALAKEAGGDPYLFGISSGGALALEAANAGLPVRGLALYEVPYVVDAGRPLITDDYEAQMDAHIAAGRRADAVKLFMRRGVGLPGVVVALMRFMPAWSKMVGVAHTLPYDTAMTASLQRGRPLPTDRWTGLTAPTLVVDGGKSPAWMRTAMKELATVLHAPHETLPGQTHIVKPAALAPVLASFFQESR